jgi:hypothetical protein
MPCRLCSLFVVLAFFFGAMPTESSERLDAYDDREAYEVFGAMLVSSESSMNRESFVIQKETDGRTNSCVEPDKASARIIGAAITDYGRKNTKGWELEQKFVVDKSYHLTTHEEYQGLFSRNGGGWKTFYQAYPQSGGIVKFSAVGFNHAKTIAMVRMDTDSGSLCGGGTYICCKRRTASGNH